MTSADPDPVRSAAFGDDPGADVPRLLACGPPTGRRRWLAAVALGGQGRYAAATTLLSPLCHGADPVLASLAGSTLASHHRQLGAHAIARRFDAVALGRLPARQAPGGSGPQDPDGTDSIGTDSVGTDSVGTGSVGVGSVGTGSGGTDPDGVDPDGTDVAGARLDALLGLAADAVGLGRTGEARRLLSAAEELPAGWRGRVRRLWVTAEVALAEGRAAAAVPVAAAAADLARASAALRHVTKSEAILATALHATATESGRTDAHDRLRGVLELSLDSGMLPLAWPSALLLADLTREGAQELRAVARHALRCILSRSDAGNGEAARESPWIPTTLLAAPER